jgi:hypothetical protein
MRSAFATAPRRLIVPLVLASCAASFAHAQKRPAGRILGVFNEQSFEPIVGAEIIDLGTGTKAVTTTTGTISLAYLETGMTILQVRKVGFASKMVPVKVSPDDTGSVTVVLASLQTTLPTVTTTERYSTADPRWKLEVAGFYDRQHSSGAPQSAYVTAEQIATWKLTSLSDLKKHTGRSVCGDVFIDGARQDMTALGGGGRNYRQGIDELLKPENIAGIEIYTAAEAPLEYFQAITPSAAQRTNSGRMMSSATGGIKKATSTNLGCAITLVWTK